jgi:ribonuclease Y
VILAVIGAALLIIVAFVILVIVVLRRILGRVIAATKSSVRTEEETNAHRDADEIVARAKAQAQEIVLEAQDRAKEVSASARADAEAEVKSLKDDLRPVREDLERREIRLAEREQRLDDEVRRLEERSQKLDEIKQSLKERKAELERVDEERQQVLEQAAGLTADQAKSELVVSMETQAKRDEMKGRIIGREGRNIRAFETATGVNLIIDDTPEAVLLSCFDPVRREVGRLTLEKLVLDGRIHPQRIEEIYEHSKTEVEQLCVRAGEDALVELGITEMHPELINLLGQLRYRTSYGQNVLKHLIESAHIAGIMAAELRLPTVLLKRCTLLHDIGKALTHEVEGSHALIGAEIARRYGEDEEVVHAIEAHHNEVEVRTVEAVLTQAADSISGGRPGARRESLEAYVKRLERLEEIATEREGVEKVFAMQAGREIRVMVRPDSVDDIQAQVIAHDIAKQVEEELTYPGQIRITVVRESRATEFAR